MTDAELETFAVDVWIAAGLGPEEPLPAKRELEAEAEAARGRIYKEGGRRGVG